MIMATLKQMILLMMCKIVCSQETIEQLENIITKGIQDALKYQTPSDARRYKPNDTNIQDYGCYDFVIIGGGTTGSVLASRLSEGDKYSVLVLEAGEFADNGILQIPRYAHTGWLSDYNWGFKSIPQTTACLGSLNKQCIYPRGRGVGGTTLINGLLYDRGAPENYNNYARLVNDNSWLYRNLLKYFKKSENFHWTNNLAPVDLQYHGSKGLLDVQHQVPSIKFNNIFLQANRELGIASRDYSGPIRVGATIAQIYTRNGRRLDMGTAFVKPFLNRTNLKVLTGSFVTKIVINDDKVAESVLFTKDGYAFNVKANKEILLSAGSVSSPQILMLSSIGPKKHLAEHGITVIEDLEVGTRFLDQPGINNVIFGTTYTTSNQTLKQQLQDFLKGAGILTGATIFQGIGFYTEKYKGMSDIEIMCDFNSRSELDKKANGWRDKIYEELWGKNKLSLSFSIRHLYPKSVGTLRLKSSDPFDYPMINPNYLSDEKNDDIQLMYKTIKFIFKLAETAAFKKINLTYASQPLSSCKEYEFKSKQYWYCFLRQVSLTAAHPVGTCSMGSDRSKGAVVDSELRVFGLEGLRVIDASVFPEPIAGHTSIPCVMLGEKLADVIKLKYAGTEWQDKCS